MYVCQCVCTSVRTRHLKQNMQTSELFQPDGNEFYSAVNGTVET